MDDIGTSDVTRNESELRGMFWYSLYNEINSLRCPSEISTVEMTPSTGGHSGDDDNNNNNNDHNRDQDQSHRRDDDNPQPSSSFVSDSGEDEEIDETLLPEKFRGKKWVIGQYLGKGSFYQVNQAYADGILLAIRKRHFDNRKNGSPTSIRRKIEREYQTSQELVTNILQKIGYHDNIATFFGFRRVGLAWEMFVEYAAGGDLYHELQYYREKNERPSERIITSRFRDLIRAVAHLHRLKIAHLDIKLENCLLTTWGSVKLSDFDYALVFNSNTKILPHRIGTKAYAPPQRFGSSIKPGCADIWSCGIVLYILIANRSPWLSANRGDPDYAAWSEYLNKKKAAGSNCVFPLELPEDTSSKFPELLEHLLDPSEDTRIEIRDVFKTSWLKEGTCCESFVVGE